jgi:hypothetical protein
LLPLLRLVPVLVRVLVRVLELDLRVPAQTMRPQKLHRHCLRQMRPLEVTVIEPVPVPVPLLVSMSARRRYQSALELPLRQPNG